MTGASRIGRGTGTPGSRDEGAQPLHLYAIGIGSNRPLSRKLGPRAIVHAAMVALDLPPFSVVARAPVMVTRPLGPSRRSYANSAVIIASPLGPLAMLNRLQGLEQRFGRRRFRRWGERTLDLDILLWSGGAVSTPRLTIPHPGLPLRDFALEPLAAIAPNWHDPIRGITVRQILARLKKVRPC